MTDGELILFDAEEATMSCADGVCLVVPGQAITPEDHPRSDGESR